MKLTVLGSTGMLGQSLVSAAKRSQNYKVTGLARSGADVNLDATDHSRLDQVLCDLSPEIIVNCIANVNIKSCEASPSDAYLVNARIPAFLADWCRIHNTGLVQISTDAFYRGGISSRHDEKEPVSLPTEYSRTKYAGECFALTWGRSLVIRTAIVGFRGRSRPALVDWAIDSLRNKKSMELYNNYYCSCIDVLNFSEILLNLIKKEATGLYNLASSDVFTKEDFLRSLAGSLRLNISHAKSVKYSGNPFSGEDVFYGLNTGKIEQYLGIKMPDLAAVVRSLSGEYEKRFQLQRGLNN